MFEELIKFGKNLRTPHTTRGIKIHLKENVAYITNNVGSIFYRLKFKRSLGTGVFSAFQAIPYAQKIESRDGKTLFEWKERMEIRRIFLSEKRAFADKVEKVLTKYTKPANFKLSSLFLKNLDNDIPFTKFITRKNHLVIQQTRSDGSMMKEDKIPSGLGAKPSKVEISVFTSDFFGLKDNVIGKLELYLKTKQPISLKCKLKFGADLDGIIGYVVYD